MSTHVLYQQPCTQQLNSLYNGCTKILQTKKQTLNMKYVVVVYPPSGYTRNLCAGVHYNTLQVFMEEITYTFDYLQ